MCCKGLAIVAIVALPGCPVVDIEADVQQVCVTSTDLSVAAATTPSPTTAVAETISVDQLGLLHSLASDHFTLELVSAKTLATSGIADFAFVTSASVSIASGAPSSTLPTLDAFSCDACTKSGASVEVEPTAAVAATNIAPYLATGSLVITVEMLGSAPEVAWSMDVDVCMTGSASYKLDD